MKRLMGWGVVFAVLAASPALASFTGGVFRYQPGGVGVGPFVDLYAHTQVKLLTTPGFASGGPFRIELVGGGDGQVPYHSGNIGDTLFQTWCIESQVSIVPNTPYWASVEPLAFTGGLPSVGGDPISDVSEWIYDQWKAGNTFGGATNGQISRALWWAEDEVGGVKNAVANMALAALGYNVATPGPLNAASHTWALNLWTGFVEHNGIWYATEIQSQLITIPVPAAWVLGVAGVGLIMRRRG